MDKTRIFFIVFLLAELFSPIVAKPINEYKDNRIVIYDNEDLNQQTLKLKNGCVLELRGGTLQNGTIDCEGDITIMGNGNTVNDFPLIKSNGNITISNVVFVGFKRPGVFIEYSTAHCKKPTIELNNVHFDGNGKIERVLRSYKNKNIVEATIIMDNCIFTNVSEYIVQFASNCTGRITNNIIHDIGNSDKSHVSALWLGLQDEFLARNMYICNNSIENILAPYSQINDGREAHGIIVYGNKNKILNNCIKNIYSNSNNNGDPGMDTEGIYLKGDNNEIAFNTIIDATGSDSDGAITIKHIGRISKKNQVHDNVISGKYSNGIVIYTDKSHVFNNQISLSANSECGICAFSGKDISIYDNKIDGLDDILNHRGFSGGIIVAKCKDIIIKHNVINNVPVLFNCIQNDGTVNVVDNDMEMTSNCLLGNNTKYTSCVVFQGENRGKVVINGNKISGKGIRGSQVIEFFDGSTIKGVQLNNNEIAFSDSPQQETLLTYVIRKAPTKNIIVTDNRINLRGNYISSSKCKTFERNVMGMSILKDTDL